MSLLGLTRVAYGCKSLAEILAREPLLTERDASGQAMVVLHTARTPRRDLAGGSLFWIVQHQLVARQPIAGIREDAAGGQTQIHLRPGPIAVRPRHLPSHQGWRYLPEELWPKDLEAGDDALPPELAAQLSGLFLA